MLTSDCSSTSAASPKIEGGGTGVKTCPAFS